MASLKHWFDFDVPLISNLGKYSGSKLHNFLAGMNTGIQDAHNLAWKIAALVQGSAKSSIINTYETERRPVLYLSFVTFFFPSFLLKLIHLQASYCDC